MTDTQNVAHRLLIGDLLLDPGERRVSRHGVSIELPGLSFRLLQALATAAPGMLTHDELIEQVWPGRVISPETLTQRVKLVRQAIGDDARDPRYIGLVRGEGYRMLVSVQRMSGVDTRPARAFIEELLQRNIPIFAVVYAVAAWALSLAFEPLMGMFPRLPAWVPAGMAVVLTIGFPSGLLIAWRIGGMCRMTTRWESTSEGRFAAAAAFVLAVVSTVALASVIYPSVDILPNDVAVLPFENANGDADTEILTEGVSGELRDQLGRVPGLTIVARASSSAFRDRTPDMKTIADRLAAKTLITGVVRVLEDSISIRVELVDGRTGTQIWSDTYEAEPDRLLVVQERIHADVIAEIAPQADRGGLIARLPTRNESANARMMIADKYYGEVLEQPVLNAGLLNAAIDTYARAVNEDPESALLRSRLAAALLYSGDSRAAEPHIQAALRLDQNLSQVQHAQGLLMMARHDDGVGEHLRRAVELNPSNVEAATDYGLYLWANTDVAGAKRWLEHALSLDRMSMGRYEVLGNFYGSAGFFDEAFELVETLPGLDSAAADFFVSQMYDLSGDLDMSIAWALRARDRDPSFEDPRWKLAELYARIGDPETARRFDPEPSVSVLYFSRQYEEMIDLAGENYFEDYSPLWLFATARAYIATDRFETVISMLRNYGLPDYLPRDSVTTSEMEAGIILADALKHSGLQQEASNIAELLIERFLRWRDRQPGSWHVYINLACLYSLQSERELALDALEMMLAQRGLPWYPRVRDQACFRIDLKDEPRYSAVLDELVARENALRARLPQTLAALRDDELRTIATR